MRVIYNGEVKGIDDVPASSSGWLEGEGIFETIKTVGNKPFSLSRHIARAQSSAVALGITIPNSDLISQGVTDLFAAVPHGLGMLRISFDNQGNWLAVHMPYAEQEKSCDVRMHPDAVAGDVHKRFPYTNRLEILDQARVAGFDDACGGVQIDDVLVGSCVPKEDAGEVMAVELAPAVAWSFDTYARAESFEV